MSNDKVGDVQWFEPVLRKVDLDAWNAWMRTVSYHAKTIEHQRVVDNAYRIAERALSTSSTHVVSWSGGKDSTVLTHLLHHIHPTISIVSEKDDADFPGELNYILWFQREWNLALTVVQPNESAVEWLRARRDRFDGLTELHARSSEFARTFFYEVIEKATQPFGCVFMGMRAEESGVRRDHFDRRGAVYQVKSGQWRANPLMNWRGIDVYAYAHKHGIELLHVYHCIGFIHAQRPWEVRKSWWLPGRYAAHSQAGWLRRYYPSLYDRWRELFPDALRLI